MSSLSHYLPDWDLGGSTWSSRHSARSALDSVSHTWGNSISTSSGTSRVQSYTAFLAPADYTHDSSKLDVDPLGDVPQHANGGGCYSYCPQKKGFHCVPGCAAMGAGQGSNGLNGVSQKGPKPFCDGKLLRSWSQCRSA